jgi:Ca2+/Na+ antiporter
MGNTCANNFLFCKFTADKETKWWFVFPAIQKSDIKEMQANKRILRKGLIIEFSILLLAMSFLSKYFIIMKNLSYWNMGIIVAAICVIISRCIGNHVQ